MRGITIAMALAAMILAALPAVAQEPTMDLVDLAVADGRFTTLVAAGPVVKLSFVSQPKRPGPRRPRPWTPFPLQPNQAIDP